MKSTIPTFEVRAIAGLSSLYAFRMLGLFMVLPVLVLYGEDYTASTPLLLGIAMGAYGLSQAIFQVPFGLLSDRLGRRPVIAVGFLIFVIGSVVAAVSDSVYGLILGRFLQGCGAIASAIMAMVADLTSDENRSKAMAAIGGTIGLSFSVALVAGPWLAGVAGLAGVFWFTAILALIGLAVLFTLIPAPSEQIARRRDASPVPQLLGETLRNADLARLNFGIFVLHFVLMSSFLVLPQVIETQMGIDRQHHWYIYLPVLLCAFVAMVPFMVIAEKRRQIKPVFLFAISLLGVTLALMILAAPYRTFFILCLFLFFVAFNLLEATLPSLMSKFAPAGAKGTASGIYSTCQFLGASAGGASGGVLYSAFGPQGVFVLSMSMVALWVLVACFMRPPRFLSGVQVSVDGANELEVYEKLIKLPGVVEVVLVKEEATAYLKVDPQLFSRDSLPQQL